MRKNYQNALKEARELLENNQGEISVKLPLDLVEVIGNSQEIVKDLAYRVGLLLMKGLMREEVRNLVGPRYHPRKTGQLRRWGEQSGYVIWQGKKVKLPRPRARDPRQEIPLSSYQAFQSSRGLDEGIWKRLVLGLSTRDYEPAINEFTEGYGLKKSTISRRFIRASAEKLRQISERNLGELDLVVIGIDGLEVANQVLVIAVGIDSKGKKHTLGLWQGATENAEVCKNLVEDMLRRGLDTSKRYLFVVDGSKALSKAIRDAFGQESLIQRCQIHKRRNVRSHLPEGYQMLVDQRLRVAYQMKDYDEAKRLLLKTVDYLEEINPSAARSLEEGLEETLTVHRLRLPDILRRTLSTTNFIESILSISRDVMRDVKRWQGKDQRLRWVGSALLEAERRMHRIRGYRALPLLINALNNKKNIDRMTGVA